MLVKKESEKKDFGEINLMRKMGGESPMISTAGKAQKDNMMGPMMMLHGHALPIGTDDVGNVKKAQFKFKVKRVSKDDKGVMSHDLEMMSMKMVD